MNTEEIDVVLTILLNMTPQAAPARIRMLGRLRDAATAELMRAARRSPRRLNRSALADNDSAIVFLLELQSDPEVTEREKRCALMLRYCIEAQEQGLSWPVLVRIASLIRDLDLPDVELDRADLELGRRRRVQQSEFAAKGGGVKKYGDGLRRQWHALRETCFAHQSERAAAINIARRLGLPESSVSSIRAELRKKLAKRPRS